MLGPTADVISASPDSRAEGLSPLCPRLAKEKGGRPTDRPRWRRGNFNKSPYQVRLPVFSGMVGVIPETVLKLFSSRLSPTPRMVAQTLHGERSAARPQVSPWLVPRPEGERPVSETRAGAGEPALSCSLCVSAQGHELLPESVSAPI